MIQTTCIYYCGVKLEVPVIGGEPLHIPHDNWYDWPDTYCGPGKIGDMIVPDKFPGGTVMTPV